MIEIITLLGLTQEYREFNDCTANIEDLDSRNIVFKMKQIFAGEIGFYLYINAECKNARLLIDAYYTRLNHCSAMHFQAKIIFHFDLFKDKHVLQGELSRRFRNGIDFPQIRLNCGAISILCDTIDIMLGKHCILYVGIC